jgi:hypothetical protein
MWTKGKGPGTLRWTGEVMSITETRKLENFLKRQKGVWFLCSKRLTARRYGLTEHPSSRMDGRH